MKKPYERSARPLYNGKFKLTTIIVLDKQYKLSFYCIEAPLYIRTGLFIHSINDFNEKSQDITFRLTLKQSWFEPRLTFNAGLVPNDTIQVKF